MQIEESYFTENRKNFWIVLFIYISIFVNSYVFFKEPFEFYFGYLIYIVLLPGFILRFGINRNLFFIFLILFVNGIINIFIGNDTPPQFFKVFIGLTLSYFFYYYVVLQFKYDIEQLFKWYLKGCYIVSLLGLFQFICFQIGFKNGYTFFHIFNKWGLATGGLFGLRVNSIFCEPTHFGAVISSAFFVAVYNVITGKNFGLSRFQNIIIILVYLLSFSGLAQLGIFLTLFFLVLNFGFIRYIAFVIPLAIIIFNYMYTNLVDFRERLDGIISMFSGNEFKLGETHGSSFVLYNNYTVALQNFYQSPVLGSGIGSHPIAFEKYSLARDVLVAGINVNGADANSMLLRLLSETGIFGVGIFLVIIIKCYVKRDIVNQTNHWLISNALLIMILLNLFRQGHYFLNGFPFFLILYYFNSVSYQEKKEIL